MRSLADFQKAFGEAIEGDAGSLTPWLAGPAAETPGLAVYRNTVTRGSIDVLAATFSTVVRIVGEDWFRAAAAVYAAERPPATPSMLEYGADFASWLSAFPPAQDTPYLPAVAQLDRLWWDAYFAADAHSLAAEALSQLDEDALCSTALALHPSVRIAAFDQNLASLWLSQRDEAPGAEFEIADTPEFILINRRALEVEVVFIPAASHAFLAACQAGASVARAASRALAVDAGASLPEIIGGMLAGGAFSDLEPAKSGSYHGD